MRESKAALRPGATLLGYLQLVRLPSALAAVSDVLMGYLFTHATAGPGDGWILGLLVTTSLLLYMAGMILNDVFDAEIDAQQRPRRPIPSGRVSRSTARRVGWQFLVAGVVAGWLVGIRVGDLRPGIVASLLAGSVILYDALLKQYLIGPLNMGVCRMLNVLLGMSLAAGSWQGEHWLVAAAIGICVAGVTWFSRGEAGRSHRGFLIFGTLVILLGVGLLGFLPDWTDRLLPTIRQQPFRWTMLMAIIGLVIGMRCVRAILEPTALRVQMAVKQTLMSLVILNAAICLAVRGPMAALAILLLLLPAALLGSRFYST